MVSKQRVENPEGRIVLIWEGIGILFLIVAGFVLHFLYEWSGSSVLVAWFCPVNESVWEHLKLGFWGVVFFSLIEYWFVRDKVNNFILAKAAGILSIQLFVLIVFYTYTSIVHTHIVVVDIMSYIIGVVICQIISYKILMSDKFPDLLTTISVLFLLVQALLLIVFTFAPPDLPIFQEHEHAALPFIVAGEFVGAEREIPIPPCPKDTRSLLPPFCPLG